jgi:hypothetical protein
MERNVCDLIRAIFRSFPRVIEKYHEKFSDDSRSQDWYLNPKPPEYKSIVIHVISFKRLKLRYLSMFCCPDDELCNRWYKFLTNDTVLKFIAATLWELNQEM